MTINKIVNGTTTIIEIEGRLDTTTAPQLEEVVKDDLGETTDLIMDFKDLQYISSAGLRVLLAAHKLMNKKGSMKITHVNDDIAEIFEVTGFTDILTIE